MDLSYDDSGFATFLIALLVVFLPVCAYFIFSHWRDWSTASIAPPPSPARSKAEARKQEALARERASSVLWTTAFTSLVVAFSIGCILLVFLIFFQSAAYDPYAVRPDGCTARFAALPFHLVLLQISMQALGLVIGATDREIGSAYRKLSNQACERNDARKHNDSCSYCIFMPLPSRQFHPDKPGGDNVRFQAIAKAYEVG
jgi:hypothetical protein